MSVRAKDPRAAYAAWTITYHDGALEVRLGDGDPAGSTTEPDEVLAALRQLGLVPDHSAEMTRRLQDSDNQPVRIPIDDFGERAPPTIGHNQSVCVLIPEDAMSAWVVGLASNGGGMASAFDIVDGLNRVGVTWGFAEKVIRSLDGRALAQPVQVAHGGSPQDGRNADIIVDLGHTQAARDEHAATVDFRKVGHATFVAKGTLLAHKVPATPGKPGMNVRGEELAAGDGADRDLGTLVGDNTELAEHEGLSQAALIAAIDGNVHAMASLIRVDPELIVPHDVDFRTGNIDFPGAVQVHGGVAPGFELKATDAIEIKGSVTGATIVSQGDITIGAGFLADAEGHDGYIHFGGTVRVGFAAGGAIQAAHDVIVRREIVRSQIYAGGSVHVEGTGQIRGAQVIAGLNVHARAIGSRLGSRTVIVAGCRSSLADLEPILNTLPPPELLRQADFSKATGSRARVERRDASDEDATDAGATDADATDAASATFDDGSGRPHVLVREHIEPGTLIMVGIHTLRPETRIHRCRIIEGPERLEVLPL